MQFGFDADQLAFRDAVRGLLAEACPPAAVRAAWAGDGPGFDRDLWKRLGEMGVMGMLAPLAAGGLGLTEVDLALVLEETGRAGLPGPLVEHSAVAVPLLAGSGHPDLLGRATGGDAVLTFSARAGRVGWASAADAMIILDGAGAQLVLAAHVSGAAPRESVDRSRRDAAVTWTSAETIAGADVDLALDRAALGVAAQLCGLAARLVELTVDYATVRRQFGSPIGTYQAVKHHLANAALRLEHARPAIYRAADSVSRRLPSRGRDVSMAKVMAGDAAAFSARVALQCHGAIGYTWESDLHLWLKRVWVLERAYGDTPWHRRRVADAVLGPPSRGGHP